MDWKAAAKMGALALNASISKAASVPLHLVVERSGKKLPLKQRQEVAADDAGRECHCVRNTRLRELVPAIVRKNAHQTLPWRVPVGKLSM
jgi:hypothetical protein